MIPRGPFSLVVACCTLVFINSCGDGGGDVTQPGAAGTTTTITVDSPDPSLPGQAVAVTVTVTSDAGTPTGDVTVSVVGGSESCSGTLSNGAATCSLTLSSEGAQTLTATYAGNADFVPSSDTELHTVSPAQPGTGQIQITTTTTGSDLDADGYEYAIDGGPSQPIGVNETKSITDVATGAHNVVLAGVAPNCSVAEGPSRAVTVAAGAAAAVSFAVTCSPVAPTVGSMRITTNTTGTDLDPDGYRFSIDGGQAQTIGVNATQTVANVPAGAHTVRISGLADNCSVSDDSRDVTVSPGVAAVVDFTVSCTAIPPSTGSIRVTTTTTGPNQDPDGYRFAIDGGSGRSIGVNGSETVTGVSVGSHTVVLSNVASNCDVAGGASKNVSVAGGQTSEVSFSIACRVITPSASRSTVLADPKTILTGATSTIRVTVRDASGALLPGVNVTLSSTGTGNTIRPQSGTTNQNGVAVFTFSSTVAGDKTISATAGGVLLNDTEVISVSKRSSTIVITSDEPDPSTAGQAFTVRFAVTGGGGGTPTGTVTVFSFAETGSDASCTVNVSVGSCTLRLSTVGVQTLQAAYSGDSQFEESSDDEQHTVGPATTAAR